MKIVTGPLMLAAAMTLAAAPAVAASAPVNPAASLSVASSVRASAPAGHKSHLALGTSTLTLGVVALIVIGAVVLIATNDTPTSV